MSFAYSAILPEVHIVPISVLQCTKTERSRCAHLSRAWSLAAQGHSVCALALSKHATLSELWRCVLALLKHATISELWRCALALSKHATIIEQWRISQFGAQQGQLSLLHGANLTVLVLTSQL